MSFPMKSTIKETVVQNKCKRNIRFLWEILFDNGSSEKKCKKRKREKSFPIKKKKTRVQNNVKRHLVVVRTF